MLFQPQPEYAGLPGRRVLGVLLVCVLALGVVIGCTVQKPQVPSMDFMISLPVADETTTLEELANDDSRSESEYLSIDDGSLLTLDFSASFERREEVGDRLSVRPTANSFDTPIGDIRLPGQELPEISVAMSALIDVDVSSGTIPLVPAASIDHTVEIELSDLQSLVIKEGGFDVELSNGLPIPLQDLRLTLIDGGNGGIVVAELPLGTVLPGSDASGAFDLAGSDISGDLQIGISGGTPLATDVEVGSDPRLLINGGLQPLVVTEATAVIPQQEFSDRQVLAFPDDRIKVTRAVISEGGLTLRVRNDIPVLMEVELSLDELRRPDGTVNTFLVDGLKPGEVREVAFNLDNNVFAPDNPLELQLSYRARTVASEGPVTIRAGGEIMVEALTQDLIFSRVEGLLNRVEIPVDPVTEEVDFPRGLDNLSLASTQLKIFLTSAVGFRSSIDLDITGTNLEGETASISVSEVFQRGFPSAPVTIIVEPPSDELTTFLNLLPTRVTVYPTVHLGDGQGTEVIEPDHWVQVDSVQFIAPARFAVEAPTEIRPDPDFRDLQDEEARGRIESNLISAEAITSIENHLPLGVSVSLRVKSWREIVRGVIVAERPDLNGSDAMLDWLITGGAWRMLSPQDRDEIRTRLEEVLELSGGALAGADDAGILGRIRQSGSTAATELFGGLLLGALQNDTSDSGKREVETLLGNSITAEEWTEIIAASVYNDPDLQIPPSGGPFQVAAAPVGADGTVTESRISHREIELTKDEVVILLRKGGVYTGVLTEIDQTVGNVVLLADYYVNVQAATKIIMELNEDLVRK
jgi:hypothetical protein